MARSPRTPDDPALGVRPAQHRWQPTCRELTLAGTPVRVAVTGEGPPLLLINGIGANIDMWQPLASRLPGRRIVMFDFPGTGGSPPLRRPQRMAVLAHLVEALLDALQIEQADVLGYSWGGVLAQEFARQFPGRVRSLVLAATTPGLGGQPPAPWVMAAMMTPLRYYSPAYLRLVAPLLYGAAVGGGETHVQARRNGPPSITGYAHQLYAVSGWSSRRWLGRLAAPTLVLASESDRLAPPRNSRILARQIPGAALEVLPGGHLFLLQQPTEAATVITAFLRRQDRTDLAS